MFGFYLSRQILRKSNLKLTSQIYQCKKSLSNVQNYFSSSSNMWKCPQNVVDYKLLIFPSATNVFKVDVKYVHKKMYLGESKKFSSSTIRLATAGRKPSNPNKTGSIYIIAIFIVMIGGAYAAVPLYKVFCQATGLGGQAVKGHDTDKIETMQKVDRQIVVKFNADVASSMRWNFKPQQSEVTVCPGETALAFYTAKNPTDKPIIGISTYNILPYDAGQYFNKIQCFCFEEQRLNPHEQVDMPVFFYIDPEFAEDPKLENVDTIMLSYTFFEAKDGLQLPLPGYHQPHKTLASTS